MAQNQYMREMLQPTFPRAKLGVTNFDELGRSEGAKLGEDFWAKFSGHFRASFAVQNEPPNFSQNSSQFITPCLVADISKFHLRELLGFGGPQETILGEPLSQQEATQPSHDVPEKSPRT